MSDPFLIEGPAVISFSGGRTSAYMLWRILQAHGGTLPEDVKVVYDNTGKEELATLDFVQECSDRWNVPITWLEYQDHDEPQKRWREADYLTASRNGEPYEALIKRKEYLPNPVTRFCTIELKIRPTKLWCQQVMGWDHWTMVIGFRVDEPRRVAKLKNDTEVFERVAPLATAGIAVRDVSAFWEQSDFDLRLPNEGGKTKHGNCDLCFLKGADQVLSLIREKPSRAVWWMRMEAMALASAPDGAVFRKDRPNYAAMHKMATTHGELFPFHDEAIECGVCID